MKKLFILLVSASMMGTRMGTSAYAWNQIPIAVSYDDNRPIGHGHGKSPMRPPVVYIEDYTLSFTADHPDYILNIKDEDGEVVYSTTVFSSMTQVTLPSTLSGDYEIELLMGNWKFMGFITLG